MAVRSPSTKGAELAVIGGGLIGASIAWGAARHGAKVALFDAGDAVSRASRGNFGLIWLQGKGVGKPDYMAWSVQAGRQWAPFSAALTEECGFDIGWRPSGGFHFCFSEAELNSRREVAQETRAAGSEINIEILRRDELQLLMPKLGDSVFGASYCAADSHVNPLLLMRALHLSLQRRGGRYYPGRAVHRILPLLDHFSLEYGGGSLDCDRLVIAPGLAGSDLAAQVAMSLPLRAERGQIVVTERAARFFPYAANCLRQTDEGSFLFGSSHDEVGPPGGTDVLTAAKLVKRATAVFPALELASIVRIWGSERVLSPDGLPIYQQSARYPSGFAVTCHSGVTLASVHALDLGPAIAEGHLPPVLASFSTDRFHVSAH
jgi:glycine/D-amino acid oxidase-like deaminating enzyme